MWKFVLQLAEISEIFTKMIENDQGTGSIQFALCPGRSES